MSLFALFVCIAVLVTVGYFLFAVLGEVALWVYNRISNRGERQTSWNNTNYGI